jgi:hypothetical protein
MEFVEFPKMPRLSRELVAFKKKVETALKELPVKPLHNNEYRDGWNDCAAEITAKLLARPDALEALKGELNE